jgi:membrane-bound lytic murein transglycosylase D
MAWGLGRGVYGEGVKRVLLCVLLLMAGRPFAAEDSSANVDELMRSAEQWAKENLNEDALRALENVDREKAKQLFASLQKEFNNQYVLDLAGLKQAARTALPILEQYEETLPYALWLKPRLDYLDVADELRLVIPPPKQIPGQPAKPTPNPSAQKEREIWVKKLAERPWPQPARAYVPRLKPLFAAQKVPAELVWIAEVESSFDPRARSPAGAAGLFQLMPDTAKRYGLRTFPFDQRLKPETSAEAAAKYLLYLHKHYKDWRLALAAYNAGEGTVDKLLKRYKARSFDWISPHLPAETQMFVPKVEGVLMRREGIRIENLRAG